MEMAKKRKFENKHWKEGEKDQVIEYLENKRSTVASTAKKFNRSENAIMHVLNDAGFSNVVDLKGCYTKRYVMQAFRVMNPQINEWLENGLVHYPITEKRIGIYEDDLWEFMKKNQDKIDFRRYEIGSIAPEPQWLKDLLADNEYKGIRRIWTTAEKNELYNLYFIDKLTSGQISKKMKRSRDAIVMQLNRIKKEKKLRDIRTPGGKLI